MTIKKSILISNRDLVELDIPSSITEAKLKDSGYTYRFATHKERLKTIMQEDLTSGITYDFRITPDGAELIGTIKL